VNRQAETSMVFGLRQSGKSQRARTMTTETPRVVIYDSMGHDYTDGVVVESLPAFRTALGRWYRNDAFRIIYRPRGCSREECKAARRIDPEFAEVSALVYECADVVFLVDELQMYADGGQFDREFLDIVTHGRHAGADRGLPGVDLIAITQVPQGLGNRVPALVDHWYIFATVHPDHIRFFRDICFGIDEQDIRRLQKYEYIYFRQGADSYWICRDDLTTGETLRQEREYLYDRAGKGTDGAAVCGNLQSRGAVERDPADSVEDMPTP